jgi:protoheme IX farnesyltransferase
MLPVIAGRAATTRQILIYSVLLVPISLLPWALGFAGTVYAATAVVSGAILVALAFTLHRHAECRDASRLFMFSIFYLFVLFAALLADHSGDRRSSTSLVPTVSTSVQADEV